ncbi:glycosyltransferase [Opitutaceae bacterium]|nr:glycosyltransferase [Opitutaceae bacterium]
MIDISFCLCTHNPRPDFLHRVVEACLNMQLPSGVSSELIMVDSASSENWSLPDLDTSKIRLVREDQAGLALARIRAIRESEGDLIVLVDDDTVLDPDYVDRSRSIMTEHPYLGAIGGQLIPEYELSSLPLPEEQYYRFLALRKFTGNHWSNSPHDFNTSPIGGGMVVRRAVALKWADEANSRSWRKALGRSGNKLFGGEDVDLLSTCCAMGFGKGIFEQLKLTHLMPAHRLTPEFLVRIFEGNTYSNTFLQLMDTRQFPPARTWKSRIKETLETLAVRDFERQILLAGRRGRLAAIQAAKNLLTS